MTLAPPTATRIVILNPLRGALHHYELALKEMMRGGDAQVMVKGCTEPSVSGTGAVRWLAAYAQSMREAAELRPDLAIAVWPAVGFFDIGLLRLLSRSRRRALIIHDPVPLVANRGYGRIAGVVGGAIRGDVELIVHGERGAGDLPGWLGTATVIPHPVLPPSARLVESRDPPVIRVLGQFKADRDLAAMRSISASAPADWRLEIVGRGWPDVPGWSRVDGFVSEEEFARAIESSSVVVVPYRRHYQSGVALRALESAVPVVGPAASPLGDVVGANSPWLAGGSAGWPEAVRRALGDNGRAAELATALHRAARAAWQEWLSGA
jgi:glycosyltransferase involved in cell wall biosynthesis